MLLILDTSHSPISPSGPLGQLPFGDNFKHALTALLSSGLECGDNAEVGRGGVGWGSGETRGLSSNFLDHYNESAPGYNVI